MTVLSVLLGTLMFLGWKYSHSLLSRRNEDPALAGRVRGEAKEPIPGARIECYQVEGARSRLTVSAVADGSGDFRISPRSRGELLIVARAPGYQAMSRKVNVELGARTEELVLELPRLERRQASPKHAHGLRILVLDGQGEPVSTARIRLFTFDAAHGRFHPLAMLDGRAGEEVESALVRSDGRLEASVRARAIAQSPYVLVHCSAPGYATQTRTPEKPGEELVFRLDTDALRLEGRVFDVVTGEPVADALVQLFAQSPEGPLAAYERTKTDGAGMFLVDSFPRRDSIALIVEAKRYVTAAQEADTRDKAAATLNVALSPGGRMHGIVLSGNDRLPIEGAKVSVSGQTGGCSATSAEDGTFSLEGIPPETQVQLLVEAEGYVPQSFGEDGTLVLKADQELRDLELILEPAVCIKVVVLSPDASPVEDALVNIRSEIDGRLIFQRTDATRDDGRVVFNGLHRDTPATLRVEHPDHATCVLEMTTPGQEAETVEVRLRNGGAVAGRVVFSDGTPAVDHVVRSSAISPGEGDGVVVLDDHKEARTDELGVFEVRGLKQGSHSLAVIGMQGNQLAEETFHAMESTTHVVTLTVEKPVALRGAILGPTRRPLADGCQILCFSEEFAYSNMQSIDRGTSEYAFEGLAPGRYKLLAKASGAGDYGPVEIAIPGPGDVDHPIELPPEVVIAGWVLSSADRRPVAGARVDVFHVDPQDRPLNPGRTEGDFSGGSAVTDAAGTFRVAGLGPGVYKLHVSHPDYASFEEDFDISPTADATGLVGKEILLGRGGKVVVEVQDRLGRPSRDALAVLGSRPTHERYLQDGAVADGTLVFDRVPSGTYAVWVMFPASETGPGAPEPRRVDLELELQEGEVERVTVREPRGSGGAGEG
ncbi:MAG: carboxypeptidase regulatory-like domain-containing protein [Planctomycetes bacterium]|nr:carboxypeptidase regulatory-like domain-containing protein [Planctomycetota bacterium]